MSIKLSKRLTKIIEMCEQVDTIVDVGTDHGKVPITLTNLGIAKNVIAVDNKKGPLEACKKNAILNIINPNVNFITLLSNGIDDIDKNTECGIIITGMGYDNMREILININDYNFKYLLLSPHTKINELISFLNSLNIDIVEQEIVFDDNKNYNIIKAVKGKLIEN